MKSLSIFLVLATLTALVLGALFAVSPALALSQEADSSGDAVAAVLEEAAAQLPAAEVASAESASAVTGVEVDGAEQAPANDLAVDTGEALDSTFTISLEKDTVSVQAAQVEPQQSADAVVVAESTSALDDFIASVAGGSASRIAGIYVDGVLASAVTGQNGNAAYVTTNSGEVTRFEMAAQYGSDAFLAHNTLDGAYFFNLSVGQVLTLVFGDGHTEEYRIQETRNYQALQPNSTQSNFVDLESGDKLSASELFYSIYNSDHPVVLQTCISNEGVSTWGRLFVIAVPLS